MLKILLYVVRRILNFKKQQSYPSKQKDFQLDVQSDIHLDIQLDIQLVSK